MKRPLILIAASLLILLIPSCNQKGSGETYDGLFGVTMPEPTKAIDRVELTTAQQNLSGALNTFGFKLTNRLYAGKSMIMSPLSLYLALGMVEAGTEGNTADELAAVLGGDAQAVNAYAKSLLDQLPAVDLDVTLRLADAVMVNDIYQINKAYKSTVEQYYYAPVENISFTDLNKVKNTVNAWCARNTEGLIPSIIDEVSPETVAYLMNALYFKAAWTDPFKDGQIEKMAFTGAGKKLDFLCEIGNIRYADCGTYHIVSRDYAKGKYKFYILLPKETDGLKTMLASLENQDWSSLVNGMKYQAVNLQFPKFETESGFELKETLMAMGIKKAFLIDEDFSPMFSDVRVFVSSVIQKAKIKLDESGTEAAAVTVVTFEKNIAPGTDAPIDFIADHPFAYVIAESTSNTVLFTGVFDGK
jgi:serpin B